MSEEIIQKILFKVECRMIDGETEVLEIESKTAISAKLRAYKNKDVEEVVNIVEVKS